MINKVLGGGMLALPLCLVGCNDSVIDDNTDGEPVQMFASIAGRNAVESRALYANEVQYWNLDEFYKGNKINVDAWHFRDLDGVRKTETSFFDSQEMTYDGSSSWIYSPVKYWPNVVDEKLAVCAYIKCTSTTNTSYCTITKNSTSGYNMKFVKSGIIDDIVVAPLTEVSRSELVEGKIPLKFYHILAQVKARVKYIPSNDAKPEENFLTVKKIELQKYCVSGTFSGFADVDGVPTAQWSGQGMSQAHQKVVDTKDYRIEANNDFKLLDEFIFCQIPFDSPFGGTDYSQLRLYVAFDNETYPDNKDENEHDISGIEYVKNVTFQLKPGKTTTFDITINGKDIFVDVSVDGEPDWSGDGGTINAGF